MRMKVCNGLLFKFVSFSSTKPANPATPHPHCNSLIRRCSALQHPRGKKKKEKTKKNQTLIIRHRLPPPRLL